MDFARRFPGFTISAYGYKAARTGMLPNHRPRLRKNHQFRRRENAAVLSGGALVRPMKSAWHHQISVDRSYSIC